MSVSASRDQVKEQIRERADLVSIVGKHTKLVKTSRGYKACCPLPGHKEKTPSFNLNPASNTYYCFGCNRGGDVFTFLEVMEGLSFREALEELAGQYNIEIPKYNRSAADIEAEKKFKSEKELGFEILERAANFFHKLLLEEATPNSKKAAEYLASRGIPKEEITNLKIGFSPEAGSVLTKKITNKGEFAIAKKVGLIGYFEDGNRHYDFFRDRLMIPIQDVRGRVIGFSGRVLDPQAKTNKYVNSRESEWFKKKTVVYGLHRAVPLIRDNDFLCVVEGYFDQWALSRLDIPAVAVMGTALTEEHLQLMGRYTKRIILIMDADRAGIESTKRSLPLVMKDAWDVKVFSGFEGKDPDEWLAKNSVTAEELKTKILSSPDGLDWLAKNTVREASDAKLGRMQIFERLRDIWGFAQGEARKNLLADELAPLLGLDRKLVRESLDDLVSNARATGPKFSPAGHLGAHSASRKALSQVDSPGGLGRNPLTRGMVSAGNRTAHSSKRDAISRATEELFVWWIRHFEALTPRDADGWTRFSQIFENTGVSELVAVLSERQLQTKLEPKLTEITEYLGHLGDGPSGEILRSWILKGLVVPEGADDTSEEVQKWQISFDELASQLLREKVKNEITRLQNELREMRADPVATAQILHRVQDLRIRLEKSK